MAFSSTMVPCLARLGKRFAHIIVGGVSNLSDDCDVEVCRFLRRFHDAKREVVTLGSFHSVLKVRGGCGRFESLGGVLVGPYISRLGGGDSLTMAIRAVGGKHAIMTLRFHFGRSGRVGVAVWGQFWNAWGTPYYIFFILMIQECC